MIARSIVIVASSLFSLATIGCGSSGTFSGDEMTVNDQPPEENLFLDSQHSVSRRFAILEDDGRSAWLYLTEADTQEPVADAWVYNRIPAPTAKEIKSYRGGPPPAAVGYASDTALCEAPATHQWSFIWATDGNSVAVAKDGIPVACIVADPRAGYSRELLKDGPWGRVWSNAEYDRVF